MGIIIFFKRNKKWVIKLLSVIFVSIIAFDFLHDLGTLERGYNAINQKQLLTQKSQTIIL